MTFNDLVIYALLLFGLYLLLMDVKMWFAPQKKGRIVAVEDQVKRAEQDCNCGTIRNCRSALSATVRTEDGELVETEMSPCLVCMDRVKLGSQIGLHRIGNRWIGRRYIDLLGRGLANDDEPIELEASTCCLAGVTE
jgi:hypothetical protein